MWGEGVLGNSMAKAVRRVQTPGPEKDSIPELGRKSECVAKVKTPSHSSADGEG